MQEQAAKLFLLEDLEDASKTKALAESDRNALNAVADWIRTFGQSAVQALAEELRRLPWSARRD